MKKNMILVLTILFIVFSSNCHKEIVKPPEIKIRYDKDIVGTWKLININSNDVGGAEEPPMINDGYIMQIDSIGTIAFSTGSEKVSYSIDTSKKTININYKIKPSHKYGFPPYVAKVYFVNKDTIGLSCFSPYSEHPCLYTFARKKPGAAAPLQNHDHEMGQ